MNPVPFQELSTFEKLSLSGNNISMLFLNIRSLRSNFLTFMASINRKLPNLDLILLCEINIKEEEIGFYSIPGFNGEFFNRKNMRGGGLAAYVKDNLKYTCLFPTNSTFESISIHLESTKMTVLGLYRPPATNNITLFTSELENSIKRLGTSF